jgi:hypothetical protein
MNKIQIQFFIKKILSFFDVRVIGVTEKRNINFLLENFLGKEGVVATINANANINCIIFSKDRPLQLHALLGSIKDHLSGVGTIHILYCASNIDYELGYQRLAVESNLKNVNWCREEDFQVDLLKIVNRINSKSLFFLVDDIIFTENVNFDDFGEVDTNKYVISLRLGANLRYCYMSNARQRLPNFTLNSEKIDDKFLLWNWSDGKWDWGYPLSLDGHIFSTNEIIKIFNLITFSNPNSLEGAMQIFSDIYKKKIGLCYFKSRLVNIPNNKVQNSNNNRFQGNDPKKLLKLWNSGFRINYKLYYGFNNKSVHEEIDIV